MTEPDRLQPGKPVAAAGADEDDRELVAYQLAATAGKDRGQAGQARAVLLADAGRESSDQAAAWGDGRKDCRLAGADGVDGAGRCGEHQTTGQ